MKKKLLSLMLAAVMVLAMFAGCANRTSEEDVEATADTEESRRVSMTLSLWLPTEKSTTEEAKQAVEEAINKLTQSKFDTAIELHLIPRDEYRDTYMEKIDGITTMIVEEEEAAEAKRKELKALKAQGIKVDELEEEETEETVAEEETIINELGISIKQYPSVGEKQMDIFLVTSYDDYSYLIENELVQQLDGELSGTSKILKQYIYPTYLQLANVDGTYAIPNNHPVGIYQYLLVNKELVDQYDYDADDLKSLLKTEEFITDIGNQHLDGVVPLLGPVEAANMVYWGSDPNEWSLLASQITNSASFNSRSAPKSVFSTNVYVNTVGMMKRLGELGYIGDGTIADGEKFAVGVITGNSETLKQYEDDYYVNIYSKPMFTEEDAYGSMLAVSAYSKSLSRSMEVITYLNTDTTFRTILQYGVQGVHWDYVDDISEDTIRQLSKDYNMKITDTGNVYMTYPDYGVSMDAWEAGKEQNLNSICSPYMKFPGHINEKTAEAVAQLDELSKEYKERFDALTADEYDDAISELKKEIKANEFIQSQINAEENENSIAAAYLTWYEDLYPSN